MMWRLIIAVAWLVMLEPALLVADWPSVKHTVLPPDRGGLSLAAAFCGSWLCQKRYKEKSTHVTLLRMTMISSFQDTCFFSFIDLTYPNRTAVEIGTEFSFCLLLSFIFVKRKTIDSEFKCCSCDYPLYKAKQRESHILNFFFST